MAYDIEAYSGHGTRRELAAQGQLADLLGYVFREAGLAEDACQVQMQGDGGLALLPTGEGVDEPRLLARLIRAFETGLAESNENLLPDRRLRLRLALHQGVVHQAPHGYAGPAVTEVCRIRDSGAVRDALAGSAGYLVVAVADGLYRDVLADGPYGLPGSAFSQVRVESKKYSADAWLYLPGAEPGSDPVTAHAERNGAGSAPAAPGTTMTQRNDVAGGGLLIGTQGGSVYVDARAAAEAPGRDGGQARAGRGARMSIEGELATLAEAAAVALVTAMGTNAWTSVRDAVTGAFRRAGAKGHDKIGDRLDVDASLVAAADDQAAERAALQPFWQLKLRELVSAAPECAPGLAEIIQVRDEAVRPAAGTHLEQHTTVRDFGRAFVAQGGNVIMHGDLTAPPASGITGRPGLPGDGDSVTA